MDLEGVPQTDRTASPSADRFCLERDIPLFGYGSMTMRREETERGLEPDEGYARGEDKPTPDLAIEVEVFKPAIDKLDVHRVSTW